MSSRALRKAQREREERERLQSLAQSSGSPEEDDESELPAAPPKLSAFAMLQVDDQDDEDDGGIALSGTDEPNRVERASSMSSPETSSKKKKKKKRKKAKAPNTEAASEPKEEELDEIDKALKQLSTNGHTADEGSTVAGVDTLVNEANSLLAIDTSHLHAQNEMRRLFGRAALEQHDDEPPLPNQNAGGNRRQQRRAQQVGLAQALQGQGARDGRAGGLAAMALKRNIFIQGKEDWPIATGGGLAMEIEQKRADGTMLYRFVHNRAYQDVQAQFESCVESMDPNRLVMLAQHNPYHISTLLQVSEIAKQERDPTTSGDLLERALFSMGRAVHSTFTKAIAEGRARLDFRRPENREFWLASWRYIQNLSMRGTWRTVYEWAKLLLSLSPEDDPYAIWVLLDQYALRARQDLDYLNISRNSNFKIVHQSKPSVQFSQALAEHRAGNKDKGNQALFTVIGRFPWFAARLMRELNIDAPPAIWGEEPSTEKEQLYAELYATRAKDLWNTPEASALLAEIAAAVPEGAPAAPADDSDISANEARNVLLSDIPSLIALVPRKYTNALQSASDPLPPSDSYKSYLADRPQSGAGDGRATHPQLRSNADNLRELQGLYTWFGNLFPWFNPARDTNADQARPEPNEDEVERRIQEAGVDRDTILERTQRLVQLQLALGPQVADEAALVDGIFPARGTGQPVPDAAPDDGSRQARAEDASDEDVQR